MLKICHIVGAGDFDGKLIEAGGSSYIIAADKGYKSLMDNNISPDLAVGDFDSLGYIPEIPDVIRHPVEKDDTDMMLAVKCGLKKNFDLFILYGALGGRLDHSLANIQLLSYISKHGKKGFISDSKMTVAAITNDRLRFKPQSCGIISVFALGEKVEGVYLSGLKYPLINATLTCETPLGVSNEFTGKEACVTVESGTLTILWYGSLDNTITL